MEIKKPTLEMIEVAVTEEKERISVSMSICLSLIATIAREIDRIVELAPDERQTLSKSMMTAVARIRDISKDMVIYGHNRCMFDLVKNGRIALEDVAQVKVDSIKEH